MGLKGSSLAILRVIAEPQWLLSGDIQVFARDMQIIFSRYKQKMLDMANMSTH